jgi:hypothetical protein
VDHVPSFSSLNYQYVGALKALLAFAGVVLFAWYWWDARGGQPRPNRLRTRSLVLVGVLSLAGWWNFGRVHFSGGFFHLHEFFHYYLGAKYLPELGYTGLYDCVAAIQIQDGRAIEISRQWVRDLSTNELRTGGANLAKAAECRAHFTPERWTAFHADVNWLFDHMNPQKRIDVLMDHGYNPTPLWSVTGHWLSNLSLMSERQMYWLALLDPLLVAIMFCLIAWAFGEEALYLALIFWGTNYPSRYNYIGGAFLRQDWLMLVVASLCLARKRYMAASGFALVWSAMLRVFPGFIGVALALKVLQQCWQTKRLMLTRDQWKFAGGCVLALAVLFPVSLTVGQPGDRTAIWTAFVHNSEKHLATPVTNNIGLPTIVAFEPSTRGSQLAEFWVQSPWDAWKDARRRVFTERRPIYWGLVAAFLALLAIAVRRQEDWMVLTLGVAAIPIFTDLASYYFSVLLCLAFLWPRVRMIGVSLCLASFGSAVMPALIEWEDARYTAISVVYVLFVVAVTGALALQERRRASVQDAAPAMAPPTPERIAS